MDASTVAQEITGCQSVPRKKDPINFKHHSLENVSIVEAHNTGFLTAPNAEEPLDLTLQPVMGPVVDFQWLIDLLGLPEETAPAQVDLNAAMPTTWGTEKEEKEEETLNLQTVTTSVWKDSHKQKSKRKKRGRPISKLFVPQELLMKTPSSRLKHAFLLCHRMGQPVQVPQLFMETVCLEDSFV